MSRKKYLNQKYVKSVLTKTNHYNPSPVFYITSLKATDTEISRLSLLPGPFLKSAPRKFTYVLIGSF